MPVDHQTDVSPQSLPDSAVLALARRVIEIEARAVEALSDRIDADFRKTAERVSKHRREVRGEQRDSRTESLCASRLCGSDQRHLPLNGLGNAAEFRLG